MDDDVRGDRGVEKAGRGGEEDDAQAYKNALRQRHGEKTRIQDKYK